MNDTCNGSKKSIDDKLQDFPALQAVLKSAARDAIRQHAFAGNPIAIWKDDRLVIEVPKLEDYPPMDDSP